MKSGGKVIDGVLAPLEHLRDGSPIDWMGEPDGLSLGEAHFREFEVS
jgi:hypothetical protein